MIRPSDFEPERVFAWGLLLGALLTTGLWWALV
jgi:hypothetical protein